jgi:16S rRNA (adenine1518-N6/adenine1519-N6)-dimethyltransferase
MIEDTLKKYNIKPSKRLGQNFLIDESILEKIITAAEISQNDTILEIGPGLGILTMKLAEKAKRVIAIEKDKKLAEILNNELEIKNIKNVEIINDDALKVFDSRFSISDYKIVANLPYYIVSPIIKMFLEAENKPKSMVLMVQKEVAQRICAKPPQMSILAVAVQFYAQPEIISEVLKTNFYPQPKVDSAIIRIKPGPTPEINAGKFFNLIRTGFKHKRKLLGGNLKKGFGIQDSEMEKLFIEIGIDAKTRAENLKIDDWIKLYGKIEDIL